VVLVVLLRRPTIMFVCLLACLFIYLFVRLFACFLLRLYIFLECDANK